MQGLSAVFPNLSAAIPAVVDPLEKVIGFESLPGADASIMPVAPDGAHYDQARARTMQSRTAP
jgi:hypothetical protein